MENGHWLRGTSSLFLDTQASAVVDGSLRFTGGEDYSLVSEIPKMPVTKTRTTQRQTASSVVNTTTVESFTSSTTEVKSFSFSRSSGKMLEDWSLPNLALTSSPQTWVSGSQAVFLSPKSPSPKRRVTRRSSIFVKKTSAGKSQSPGKGKGEFFKAPLPAKPKVTSPPLSSRTRRSSVYKKGSAAAAIASFQVAQEFKTKSPEGKPSLKRKQSPKSKPSKSPVAAKSSRKRNMTEVEKEDSPEIKKSAAKRRRGQLGDVSPRLSPIQSQKGSKGTHKTTRVVSKAKSQQTAVSTRVKKRSVQTPRKKAAVKSKSPAKKQSPPKSKSASSGKRGKTTGSRTGEDEKEMKADENSSAGQPAAPVKTQTRKRKLPSESPDATTPQKSAKSTPRSSTKISKSASKSRSVKKSGRRTASKVLKSSPGSTRNVSRQAESFDESIKTPVSQSKSASTKRRTKTPKSGLKSGRKSAKVPKSSTKTSASKSLKKSAARSKSTSKSAKTKRQISLEEEAADAVDGSFLQLAVQNSKRGSQVQNQSSSPVTTSSTPVSSKRSIKKSPKSQSRAAKSASKSVKTSSKKQMGKRSRAPSPRRTPKTPKSPKWKSPGKSASSTQEKTSVAKSGSSVSKHIKFDTQSGDALESSYVQVSLTKLKSPKVDSPQTSSGKKAPTKSPRSRSRSKESMSKSATKLPARGRPKKAKTPEIEDLTPRMGLLDLSTSSIKKSVSVSKSSGGVVSKQSPASKKGADLISTPNFKRTTPSPTATSRLRTIQKSGSSTVKRLNLSPNRSPRPSAVATSTPKSTGKRLSLRKSLLTSLHKSANLSRNLNEESFSNRFPERELVLAETSRGGSEIVSPRSRATLRPQASGTATFSQYVERKASNTVERYGTAVVERTDGGLTYRAGGFRIERESGAHVESQEEFGEWADADNSALTHSDTGNGTFGTSTYSSRCAIL